MALTSLSCTLPEGKIWGKVSPAACEWRRETCLRRTKPQVLKVAGNLFALKRESIAGERKNTAICEEILYMRNPFFLGHALLQEYVRSLQVGDSMCICLYCLFLWHPFYLPGNFYSLLLYLLQLLSLCTTQLHTSQLVVAPLSCASLRAHLKILSMPFCVCVCSSPAFHIAMVKETQLGLKKGESCFRQYFSSASMGQLLTAFFVCTRMSCGWSVWDPVPLNKTTEIEHPFLHTSS